MDEGVGVRRTHHGFKQFLSHTWALLCAFVKMQLLGSRVQNIQVPECSPEGCRNVGGKAAREQTLGWVSTDIYMLLYVFGLLFCFVDAKIV
jgi:hypothetical protein